MVDAKASALPEVAVEDAITALEKWKMLQPLSLQLATNAVLKSHAAQAARIKELEAERDEAVARAEKIIAERKAAIRELSAMARKLGHTEAALKFAVEGLEEIGDMPEAFGVNENIGKTLKRVNRVKARMAEDDAALRAAGE